MSIGAGTSGCLLASRLFADPGVRFPAFTASVCNLNPTSHGSVRIRSACIEDPLRIAPKYLATGRNRRVAADSLRHTRRIVAQRAFARYSPEDHLPAPQFTMSGNTNCPTLMIAQKAALWIIAGS